MKNKIKHPYILDVVYQVEENSEFEELEDVTVKVFEFTDKAEEENLHFSEREDYLEINIKRIIMTDESNCGPIEISDSDSQEMYNAIIPVANVENEEFIGEALDIDSNRLLDKFIYIDTIKIHGDFSEESISAAISESLKKITKGYAPEDWVAVIYEDRTIFKNEEVLDRSESVNILRDLGFFRLPKVVTGIDRKDNTLAIVGGETLNKKLDYSPELFESKKTKKLKP